MGDDVAGGAAITKAGCIFANPAAPGSQFQWRDDTSVIGASINLSLRGNLSDASSGLTGGWCCSSKRAEDNVVGINYAVDLRLTPCRSSVSAFLDGDDCLFKLSKRAGVKGAGYGNRAAIPHINAVLALRGLVADQHPVL